VDLRLKEEIPVDTIVHRTKEYQFMEKILKRRISSPDFSTNQGYHLNQDKKPSIHTS